MRALNIGGACAAGRGVVAAVAVGLLAAAMPAAAQSSEARAWLARMHAAAMSLNYEGTMVFSAGPMMSSMRVAHYCVDAARAGGGGSGKDTFELVEALGGREQRSLRHNDLVHTFWPQEKRVLIEPRNVFTPAALPAAPVEPRIESHYDWKPIGADRVAGREAQVFRLQPKDDWRFAQRIWADTQSGLMLRVDVLGAQGEVLESSAFSSLQLNVRPNADSVRKAMQQLDGYAIERPAQRPTRLADEGWQLEVPVPGFQLISCARRSWGEAPDAAGKTTRQAEPELVQAVFHDGLTHVSLFIETFDANRHKQSVHTRMGATHTLMKRLGERWWVTAMGDVPSVTLQRFIQSLKRQP
jgi:sigma-E factor negative regulatory protein RseB